MKKNVEVIKVIIFITLQVIKVVLSNTFITYSNQEGRNFVYKNLLDC